KQLVLRRAKNPRRAQSGRPHGPAHYIETWRDRSCEPDRRCSEQSEWLYRGNLEARGPEQEVPVVTPGCHIETELYWIDDRVRHIERARVRYNCAPPPGPPGNAAGSPSSGRRLADPLDQPDWQRGCRISEQAAA